MAFLSPQLGFLSVSNSFRFDFGSISDLDRFSVSGLFFDRVRVMFGNCSTLVCLLARFISVLPFLVWYSFRFRASVSTDGTHR